MWPIGGREGGGRAYEGGGVADEQHDGHVESEGHGAVDEHDDDEVRAQDAVQGQLGPLEEVAGDADEQRAERRDVEEGGQRVQLQLLHQHVHQHQARGLGQDGQRLEGEAQPREERLSYRRQRHANADNQYDIQLNAGGLLQPGEK